MSRYALKVNPVEQYYTTTIGIIPRNSRPMDLVAELKRSKWKPDRIMVSVAAGELHTNLGRVE